MKKYLLLIYLLVFFHFSMGQKAKYIPGKLFVKLKDNAGSNLPVFKTAAEFKKQRLAYQPNKKEQQIRASFLKHKVASSRKAFKPKAASSKLHKVYHLQLTDSASTNLLINELKQNPDIEYIERIPLYEIFNTPNDLNPNQWNLTKVQVPQAWDLSMGVTTVVIAIVDDEVRLDHEDLSANIWVNPGEIAGNGIDDDGNGYIDDIHGYDVADNDNNPTSINTVFTHGTHCAGIAAASTNNGIGIASPSYKCKIMAVKTKSDSDADEASLPYAYEGLFYAIETKPHVISMSWGGYYASATYQLLIDEAHNKGIVLVAAAGNSNTSLPMYPASYNHVISVGATDGNDVRAFFSNYGTTVDIMAPGLNIYSTLATTNSSYGYLSGTSMACPLVAGICALMLSYEPSASPDAIEACLKSGADDISSLNPGYEGLIGAGRVNAFKSLTCLKGTPLADFNSTITSACIGQSISFTDESYGVINSWNWTFTGGNPAFSNVENPVVTYAATGSYPVTLRVQNAQGADVKTKLSYINIIKPSATISGNATINKGLYASLKIDFTGNAPYSFSYTDGTNTFPVSGVTYSPYYLSVSPNVSKTYTLYFFSDKNCNGSISGIATIKVTSVSGPDLTNGLIASYLFCGNANDVSGNGNNGTVSGATLTTDRFGNAQSAYQFNGTNNSITAPLINSTNATYSLWVYSNSSSQYTLIFTNGDPSLNGYGLSIENQSSFGGYGNIIKVLVGLLNGNAVNSTYALPINTWTHLTLTKNINDFKLYINGIPRFSGTNNVNTPTGDLLFGKGNSYFKGKIDDIKIYDRVLSDAEITSLYNEPAPCTTNGLIAFYPFCGNANDVSGNGNNGTVVGTATYSVNRFSEDNGAFKFNGNTVIKTEYSGVSGTASRTFNVWIKPDASYRYNYQYLMAYGDALTNNQHIRFGINFNQSEQMTIDIGNAAYGMRCPGIYDGQWHMLTYVVPENTHPNNVKFYMDGKILNIISGVCCSGSEATAIINTVVDNPFSSHKMSIGVFEYNTVSTPLYSAYFHGEMDDVRFFDKELNASDVYNLYNSDDRCNKGGLVASYPFCGNADDVSGNGNNGTVSGASLTTDRFGNKNSAYFFDGISNFIKINNLPDVTEDISISLWIKSSSVNFLSNKAAQILWRGDLQFARDPYMIYFHNGELGFRRDVGTGLTSNEITISTSLLDTLSFHHIVSTYNSSTGKMKLYIDGNLQANSVLSGSINYSTSNFWNIIGAVDLGNSQNYKGIIDDIKIYKQTLSESEILTLYNEPAPCATTGLIASYPFCGNANDVSGNGNNGTVSGASLATDRFGNKNSAYSFNGINNFISVPGSNFDFSNDMSISVWCKPNNVNMNDYAGIIDKSHSTDLTLNSKGSWVIERDGSSNLFYYAYQCSTDPYLCNNQTQRVSYTANQWVHYAFSKHGNTVKSYINGVLKFTDTYSNYNIVYNDRNFPLIIGAERESPTSINRFFSGLIDDIKIYNKALSGVEISSLYNEPAPCTCSGVTTPVSASFSTVGTICGVTYFTPVNSSTGPVNAIYYWNFGSDANPSEFYGYTPPKVFYKKAGLKNIKLKVTGQCEAVDSVTHQVTVFPVPVASAGPDIDICTLSGVVLGTTAVSGYKYQWHPGKYLSDSTVSNPILTAYYKGKMIVKVSYGETACIAYDTMNVNVLDKTFNTFYSPQVISECNDAVLTISSSLPENKYLWSTGETSSSIVAKNSGIYTVVTYNTCVQQTDTINVTINRPEDHIPNVITPNHDGINDVFTFDGCFAWDTDFNFTVYNRLGTKVYESASYNMKWDADGISDGLYYYALIDNKTGRIINGWLEIIR